jgi:DnaJ domain
MSQVSNLDPYRELGISPQAEPEVIEGAYRALARKYHPDVNPQGAERMKRINAAHDLLRDPEQRRAYDRSRGKQQGPAEARSSSPPPRPHGKRPSPPPPPPQEPKCGGCGIQVKPEAELCSGCHAGQLRRRLRTAAILFAVPLAPLTVLLHSLPAAVITAYLLAAIPSGGRCLSRIKASSYGAMLPKPPADPGAQPGYLIKLGLLIAALGLIGAPVELAQSAWELHQIRKQRETTK